MISHGEKAQSSDKTVIVLVYQYPTEKTGGRGSSRDVIRERRGPPCYTKKLGHDRSSAKVKKKNAGLPFELG